MTHLKVISKGLERLGEFYLELDTLHKLAACQKDLIQVARENLTYVENRLSIGTGTSLEVKMAQQQLELALGEQEGIALSMKTGFGQPEKFPGVAIHTRISPPISRTAGVRCWAVSIRPPLPWSKPRTALTNSRRFEIHKQLQAL